MRVGLYYDLRNPGGVRPWDEVYAAALRQIEHAEAAGIDAVWFSEHHGFADGYLPAPLTFAAAAAARTARVRIGTAVVIAGLLPARTLAEQAAVVDGISGGRLELGLGAGWREPEFAGIGAEFRGRYERLERAAAGLAGLWAGGTATPPPVQDPLPLWIGARGPRGAQIAGRLGAGLLWLDHELMPAYREGLEAAGHGPEVARVGGLVNMFLADDPDEARHALRDAGRAARASYAGNDRAAGTGGRAATFPKVAVLSPGDAVEHVERLTANLPVSDIFCWADIGGLGATRPDLTERHAELVAGELAAALVTAAR